MPAATSARFSAFRAASATPAPALASHSAQARPIPWLAPVTRAHFPLKSMEIISPSLFHFGG